MSAGITALIAWCFYSSPRALLVYPAVLWIVGKYEARRRREERHSRFMADFAEMLTLIVASLRTGYSVENAFFAAERDLAGVVPADGEVMDACHRITQSLRMHVSVEQAVQRAAVRLPYEELDSFARLLSFAKRLGGDYSRNIERSAASIRARISLKQEIGAAVAAKEFELKVMDVMPALILVYIRLTSSDYLAAVYHTPAGVLLMSACLAVYGALIAAGDRIVRRAMEV